MDAKRPHTHDVRVLLVLAALGQSPLMLSAGNDTQLIVHEIYGFAQKHPTRVCRVPQPPLIAAPTAGVEPSKDGGGDGGSGGVQQDRPPAALVTSERDHVDVWRLKLATPQQMVHFNR